MRSTTATGWVLAVGLMVLFSLTLAGQSAWGAETTTKARPDKQGACSYKKNPGTLSIAKAEIEGAGAQKERLGKARKTPKEGGHELVVRSAYMTCTANCDVTYENDESKCSTTDEYGVITDTDPDCMSAAQEAHVKCVYACAGQTPPPNQ